MKLATILAGTAVASLFAFADIGKPIGLAGVTSAQAQATVSFSIFYNGLADHGDWVRYRDTHVFIPANVQRGWRPYTLGHWIYANDYGWTWASDEPFGWATYHYGRWGYADDIGWYWVPGTRWAPAWVSWRRSKDHVVWAPLPPRGGTEVTVEISVGNIPEFYWVAVPTRRFLDEDIRTVIIVDDRERRRIVERAEFLGTPRVQNNIVVNTVIDIDIIQRETGRQVRRVDVRKSNDPREARASADQITVFEGELQVDAEAKPTRVKKVEEIKKVTREDVAKEDVAKEDVTQEDVTQEDVAQDKAVQETEAEQTDSGAETVKSQQPAATGTDAETADTAEQPADGQAEAPATETETEAEVQEDASTDSKAAESDASTKIDAPAAEAEAQADAPAAKTDADAEAQTETEAQLPNEKAAKPKSDESSSEEDISTGSTGKANKGRNKNSQECDPAVNPDCVPQQ